MKKILVILNLILTLAVVGATLIFVHEHAQVCHERDGLEDDKAALLIERAEVVGRMEKAQQDLEQDLQKTRRDLEKAQADKESLGRSLVKAMGACTKLQNELKLQQVSLNEAAIEKAVKERVAKLQAERERQEREKARIAKEKAAKAKAEAERLARERAPLRVEELKPLNPKAKPKSDKESLDELLELSSPKK